MKMQYQCCTSLTLMKQNKSQVISITVKWVYVSSAIDHNDGGDIKWTTPTAEHHQRWQQGAANCHWLLQRGDDSIRWCDIQFRRRVMCNEQAFLSQPLSLWAPRGGKDTYQQYDTLSWHILQLLLIATSTVFFHSIIVFPQSITAASLASYLSLFSIVLSVFSLVFTQEDLRVFL